MRTALVCLWLGGLALMAQDARVSGMVHDSSGGIVQDARVSVINEETGLRYASRSGLEGYYTIPAARPGLYKIAVRKEGFRTLIRMGVRLAVDESARVDFTLQAGSIEETIVVTADSCPITADNSSVSTVIGRDFIDNLPLNGRGLLTLLESAPGVVITPVIAGQDAGQFSVNGQRASANYITVDGIGVNNGVGLNSGMPVIPTNLQAPRSTVTQTLGGALPAYSAIGSMQNLVSMEALEEFRLVTSNSGAEFGRMPGGNLVLSTRSGGNGLHGSLFEYFRNNKLDANDWFDNRAGVARPPLGLNDFGGTLGGPIRRDRAFFFVSQENLRLRQTLPPLQYSEAMVPPPPPALSTGISDAATAPKHSALNSTSLRLDDRLSGRVQLFARYQHAPSSDVTSYLGGGALESVQLGSDTATAGLDVTIGRIAYQSLRFNYSFGRETVGASGNGASQADLARFMPAFFPIEDTSYTVFLITGFARTNWLSRNTQRQWNLVDTLSASHGSHLWQAGVDCRLLAPRIETRPYLMEADYANAWMMSQGTITLLTIQKFQPVASRFRNLSLFAQDAWKVSSRLTVTAGLRWESNPPPDSAAAAPPFAALDPAHPQPLRTAFDGHELWKAGYRHMAPRLGMALRLTPSGLVFRAAAGLHYDLGFGQALAARMPSTFTSLAGVAVNADANAYTASNDPAPPQIVSALASDFTTPMTIDWNGTLEQAISRHGAVSVSYVGTAGRRLLLTESVLSSGQPVNVVTNRGASHYQALQSQVRMRIASRLQSLVSFTWGHSIDNVSQDGLLPPNGLALEPQTVASNRGNSDYDVRRSFSTGLVYRLPRGWTLNAICRARTGFPINVLADGWRRPDLVFGQPVWIRDANAPGGEGLNPGAFQDNGRTPDGTLGRNAIAGQGMAQVDVSLGRQFRVTERLALELRLEAFNATNHPNFGNPGPTLRTSGVTVPGVMLNQYLGSGSPIAGLTPALQIGGPRAVELALRLRF